MDHDDILQQHQTKMEMHKRWLEEQQMSLRGLSSKVVASGTNTNKPHPSQSAVATSEGHFNIKQEGGGSAPRVLRRGAEIVSSNPSYTAVSPAVGPSANASRTSQFGSSHELHNQSQSASRPEAKGQHYSSARKTSQSRSSPQPYIYHEEDFVSTNTGSPITVHMRGTQWAKRREQRLEEQRQQRLMEELQDCTFTPNVEESLSQRRRRYLEEEAAAQGEQELEPIVEVAPGISEFLFRQERARQQAKEREVRLCAHDGSSWHPEPTVPEPFHLAQRVQTGSIRSLRQPIQAPHRSLLDPSAYVPYIGGSESAAACMSLSQADEGNSKRSFGADGAVMLPPPGAFSSKHFAS